MSDANEDVELARAWLQGKSELMDDLADLVESMMDKPLDASARTFISTIGRDAKAMAKRKDRSLATTDPAKAQTAAQPTQNPPQPRVDLNELWRRRLERERARRLDELGRRNQEAFMEQRAFMAGNQTRNDADWRGW
jgi:predicted thioredoxin/glutaredoxin